MKDDVKIEDLPVEGWSIERLSKFIYGNSFSAAGTGVGFRNMLIMQVKQLQAAEENESHE